VETPRILLFAAVPWTLLDRPELSRLLALIICKKLT